LKEKFEMLIKNEKSQNLKVSNNRNKPLKNGLNYRFQPDPTTPAKIALFVRLLRQSNTCYMEEDNDYYKRLN